MFNTSTEMVDHQICALFYKLRNRFAEDLKNSCTEIAREVREASSSGGDRCSLFLSLFGLDMGSNMGNDKS